MTDELDRVAADYRALGESLRGFLRTVSNFAATLEVTGRPDEDRLRSMLGTSARVFDQLATFLQTLDGAIERSTSGQPPRREAILDRFEELEPPPEAPEEGDETTPPGSTRFEGVSPLKLLSVPYDLLLNVEEQMVSERIRRPFRFVELKRLWGDTAYLGGDHPSDGLLARLTRLHERLREVLAGGGGQLFDEELLEELGELSRRAEAAANWDGAEVAERERDWWIDRVENWVEAAETDDGPAHHTAEMMHRFLTDLPSAPDDRVADLLDRIAEAEAFPDELRDRAADLP
ncbi:MAG: hypothetical protein ABEL76_05915 [Bradymonadaceae bacterium]